MPARGNLHPRASARAGHDARAGPAGELLDRAVAVAEGTPEDCLKQYTFTKRACQAAALRDIAELADPLDGELPDGMTSDQARHAHRRYWQQLKGSPPRW